MLWAVFLGISAQKTAEEWVRKTGHTTPNQEIGKTIFQLENPRRSPNGQNPRSKRKTS